MVEYIHHVPGRIRVKSPLIKKNEANARAAMQLVQSLDGVTSVEVNPVTGSVIVNYDKHVLDPFAMLSTLKLHGYIDSAALGTRNEEGALYTAASKVGEAFGKAVFGALVDKAIERSAMALVGALI